MDDELHASSPVSIPEDLERLPPEEEAAEPEAVPKAEPKKRGRPVGSKSKEPGKPRAPRVKKVSIAPEQPQPPAEPHPMEPQPVERPRVLAGSRPIPHVSYDEQSTLMLALLQQQAHTRRARKVEQWKNWFR